MGTEPGRPREEAANTKPFFFSVPNDLHARMLRAGLDAGTRDLNVAAWSHVAVYQTDALLTDPEVAGLPGFTRARMSALLSGGFWRRTKQGIAVVEYLDGGLNRTKDEIEKLRAGSRRRSADSYRRKKLQTRDEAPAGTPDTSEAG